MSTKKSYPFPQARLDAWHVARQARKAAFRFSETLPRGFANQRHQLNDAAVAVVHAIGEGAQRFQPADKIHRFEIASAEAGEAVSAVLTCLDIEVGDPELAAEFVQLMERVGAMLTGLIRRQRRRQR